MRVYGVFPGVSGAAENAPGGPLYVPTQGAGRFDGPGQYRIRYASTTPEGAIAEAFGRFFEWSRAMLDGPSALPGSQYALADLQLSSVARLCDLNDPERLIELGMRPSDVVARDYARTQSAARAIHASGLYDGIAWWSFYDPDWTNVGFWNDDLIESVSVNVLVVSAPAVIGAAERIRRIIRP